MAGKINLHRAKIEQGGSKIFFQTVCLFALVFNGADQRLLRYMLGTTKCFICTINIQSGKGIGQPWIR